MNQEKIYTIAFSHIPSVGPVSFKRLASYFPTLYEAWHASSNEYARAGLSKSISEQIISERSKIDIEAVLVRIERENISAVTKNDEEYPCLLSEIHDPPFILYYRGFLPARDRILFGVVGSRKATSYGLQCTHRLIPDLARRGIGIVSGLAYGIDAASHEAALANDGYTIAVLACGVDHASVYPAIHKNLAERIVANRGCVMSEYPPGTMPMPFQFPFRNRIIAGISKGVLVVEAVEKSGALITATCALELGREVCAVPGPISSPSSAGTNRLLKNGAHVITESADIFLLLGYDEEQGRRSSVDLALLSGDERKIYNTLSCEPTHLDELARQVNLDTQVVISTLVMLEMKNLIRSYARMQYSRV